MVFDASFLLPVTAQDKAEEPDQPWPNQLEYKGHKIVVYQPQPESFEGDKITGRAAVSVTSAGDAEPKFGAIWIEARVSTDRDERVCELLELKITKVRFPDAPEDKQKKLVKILEQEMPKWAPNISLDRLLTSLDTAKVKRNAAKDLKIDPPPIVERPFRPSCKSGHVRSSRIARTLLQARRAAELTLGDAIYHRDR